MISLSANLGFLWSELELPDAIHAAARAGFDAVECHWPYDVPADAVLKAIKDTGLPMLGLNTVRGDTTSGENGLAALPGRQEEARQAIDQALEYAEIVGAEAVHVMAGVTDAADAEETYLENLQYACGRAGTLGKFILIEPLNQHDAPGYFLKSTDQARAIIQSLGSPNLKLMFDCYHVGRTEGDVTNRLEALLPIIGHIQVASVPDRGPLHGGELPYARVFAKINELGWKRPVGAEYKPPGPTDETLGWMSMKHVAGGA